MASERTGNLYRYTGFRNGGRKAGIGILYDDYSEDSEDHGCYGGVKVRFPRDNIKPEELNGPVICYKAGERRTEE